MSERRQAFRYRTNRSAKICRRDGSVIECMVRDLSTRGARLEVDDPRQVPDNFHLIIQGMSERFGCDVVWRTGNFIGVQYQ